MTRHTLTWFSIFVVIAAMFLRLPQMAAKQDTVRTTYAALVEVDALAQRQYVEVVDDNRLVQGAIRGMMVQLDPYSGYIAPDQLSAFERRAFGAYVGTGIEVGFRDRRMAVIAALEGSPAGRLGVLPGDVILAINGRSVDLLSVFDVTERLVGREGEVVHVSIRRPGEAKPRAFEIPCAPVTMMTVRGFRRFEDGRWDFLIDAESRIGYIRISRFIGTTIRDFDAALRELSSHDPRGLILDLRFNPGGLMRQGVAMVDRFVSDGLILSTVSRRRVVHEFRAFRANTWSDLPLVVIINASSASSAEIVSGSLQDHGRAVIVGDRSFGKGSVQQLIYLTEQRAAIKLTTARYSLPSGRIIHRTPENADSHTWGVTPDVVVALTDEETRAIQSARRIIDEPGRHGHGGLPSVEAEIIRDRQLTAAIDRLRGTSVGYAAAP